LTGVPDNPAGMAASIPAGLFHRYGVACR
jgi:hypothetical protein